MCKKKMFTAGRAGVGLIAQLLLVILALYISPALADRKITSLPDEGKGGLANSSENQPSGLLSEDGMPYPDAQAAPRPVIDPSWAEELANMDPSEMVRVIIFLKNQPQSVISREVRQKHATELASIRQEIRSIHQKYTAKRDESSATDAENYSHQILTPGSEDRLALDVLNERHEAVSLKVNQDMAAALKTTVESDQASVKARITALGGEVESSTIAVNAIIARVPAGSISKIAALSKAVRIAEDRLMDMQLNLSDETTLVTTTNLGGGLWDNGYCGGTYDPAVLDTGTDIFHPALADSASRSNVYLWSLDTASSDSTWNDITNVFDLQGHGTHVQGIVSSMGTPLNPDFLGMANCVNKAITLKAGWRNDFGEGKMYWSDAMMAVDRALYSPYYSLIPVYSFNDDVDGINLSFGEDATADESDFSRFIDSIISTYPDLVVTISAGNSGPINTVFYDPANNYNAITVSNVSDRSTPNRDDDSIYNGDGTNYGSTRGPTLNGRRKPDIAAPGTHIHSANHDWEEAGEDEFIWKTGTSMAAPMILGIAMDLMDAGVLDELEIKALLLNTAQKNNTNIDFESDDDGWDEAYGWGYVNAWSAYSHRADVRTDSVTPAGTEGDYVLYKGQMRDEGPSGEGRDRVTMVWNRHVDYNTASYPTTYYGLSDLNLSLYDESNGNLIDEDATFIDNVHQVRVAEDVSETDVDVVVKAYASSINFAHGGATEEFALATEENFVKVDFPDSILFLTEAVFDDLEPNEEGDFWVTALNRSDIATHNNRFWLLLPDGWTLVAGSIIHDSGTIAAGEAGGATWRLRAPPTAVGSQIIQVVYRHSSYGESFGPSYIDMDVNVVPDTPPSPDPMTWATEPYEISTSAIEMVATTATDFHVPVEYYFFAEGLTGGGGATSSGWVTSTTYTNTGLGSNHQYRYRVLARDAATTPNWTAWSTTSDEYTAIEASTGVTFGTITTTSIEARSTNTPSGLTRGSSGLNVINQMTENGSGWKQNNDFWTSTGLSPNKRYCFVTLTRNGDAAITWPSSDGCTYTMANFPYPDDFSFSAITENSIQVNWQLSGNPVGTQYLVENTSNGATSGWTTALSWNNTGLDCGTSYSYQIKARNGDLVETVWIGMGSEMTNYCFIPDTDEDGILDNVDNCTLKPNPAQRDTDGDGYGNFCDADFDNNLAVNFADLGYMKSVFFTADAEADLNGDGAVNFADLGLLKSMFFQSPGPSGLVP